MNRCKRIICFALLLIAVWMLSAPSAAASKKTSSPKYKNKWVQSGGKYYYYNKKGKKLKGIRKVGKRTYYFDETGAVLSGWRKIGNDYYRLRYVKGSGAWMYHNTVKNGIRIKKSGKADVSTPAAKRKVELMVKYLEWVESFTNPKMTDKQKLYACLYQLQRFRYRAEGDSILNDRQWDMRAAEEMYNRKSAGAYYGNCYRFAAAFAYMANAVGYTDVRLYAYWGHGWVKVNGVLYDPAKAVNRYDMSYFPVASYLRGEYHAMYTVRLGK